MPDPAWPSSPPEVNYLRLAGPGVAGVASTVASGTAWQTLAISGEVAASISLLNTAATAPDFQGVGGLSSSAAVTGLNTALHLLAGWAQEKPPIAASAAAAYQTAVSAMIPAEISLANRAEQAADVALNPMVLGALTPAIVALDAVYFGEHWPHNAGIGAAYGTTLAGLAAALAVPPPIAPLGASPAAPATAAGAVAQAAGTAAAGEAMKQAGQFTEQAARLPAAGAEAAQPLQAFSPAAGAARSSSGMFASPAQSPYPEQIAPAILPGLGVLPSSGGGGAVSSGGAPTASLPPSGLTRYTKPLSGFESENSGRPVGVRSGPLSAELRGPGWSGVGVGPMPTAGSPTAGRSTDERRETADARVVVDIADAPGQVCHRVK